ncbi:MAG: hypothetical protein QXO70_02040, partial [Candidatus Pacearchaeota archaeon]
LNFTGFIGQNTKEIIDINFNRQNSDNSSAEKIVTFQGLIEDINEAKFLNLINKSAANSLLAIAKNAKKQYENDRRKIAITQLNTLKKLLNSYNKIPYELLIKMEAYRILLYDVDYLISHI